MLYYIYQKREENDMDKRIFKMAPLHHHFEMSIKQTQFITVSTALLVTALNTLVMWLDSVIYDYYSFAYIFGAVPTRIVAGILTAVVFAVILPKLLPPLRRFLITEENR